MKFQWICKLEGGHVPTAWRRHWARGSGERCKLPQRGPGRSPGLKRILDVEDPIKRIWWWQISFNFRPQISVITAPSHHFLYSLYVCTCTFCHETCAHLYAFQQLIIRCKISICYYYYIIYYIILHLLWNFSGYANSRGGTCPRAHCLATPLSIKIQKLFLSLFSEGQRVACIRH